VTRRTWTLLAVLVAALLLSWLSHGVGGDAGGEGIKARPSPAAKRVATRGGRGDEEPVREVVALLSPDVDDVPAKYEPGRDPFRFYQPPVPPPPPPPPPPTPTPVQDVAPPPPPPPAKPQPPPVDVQYLGSFGPSAAPIAVFTDGEEIYNVRQGGVIKGKFQVVQIGYESADLSFVGFPDAPAQRLPVGRAR